jgi:hypothetical protein
MLYSILKMEVKYFFYSCKKIFPRKLYKYLQCEWKVIDNTFKINCSALLNKNCSVYCCVKIYRFFQCLHRKLSYISLFFTVHVLTKKLWEFWGKFKIYSMHLMPFVRSQQVGIPCFFSRKTFVKYLEIPSKQEFEIF